MSHVIIGGFGPIGRTLAETLARSGVPATIVESNAATVKRQRPLGRSIIHGDIANPEVLRLAGVQDAAALVLTMPYGDTTARACQVARLVAPDIFIAARAGHLSEAIFAREMGADTVTVEEIVTAESMARSMAEILQAGREPVREGAD